MTDSATAMHTVAGKVIIVTGAGRGVGKGMAVHLGKGGAKVVVAEWKADLLESAVARARGPGRRDARRRSATSWSASEIEAMVAATVDRFGRVDGLINNAQTFRALSPDRRGERATTSTSSTTPASRARCGRCRRCTRTCATRAGAAS